MKGIETLRKVLFPIFRPILRFVEWTIDYTGPLAELVKTIPVILMAICIFYPAWSWPFWMKLGMMVGYPSNLILLGLWSSVYFVLLFLVAAIGYTRENIGRTP
jgi:hypothetical protein